MKNMTLPSHGKKFTDDMYHVQLEYTSLIGESLGLVSVSRLKVPGLSRLGWKIFGQSRLVGLIFT